MSTCSCVGESLTPDQGNQLAELFRLLRAARLLRQKRQGKNVLYHLPDCHVATMLTNMMDHVVEPDDAHSEE